MHLSFWICLLLGHYLVKKEWRIIRIQMVSMIEALFLRAARFGDEHTNHEATMPPKKNQMYL